MYSPEPVLITAVIRVSIINKMSIDNYCMLLYQEMHDCLETCKEIIIMENQLERIRAIAEVCHLSGKELIDFV